MVYCTAPLRERLIVGYENKIKVYRNNLASGQPDADMRNELMERISKAETAINGIKSRNILA